VVCGDLLWWVTACTGNDDANEPYLGQGFYVVFMSPPAWWNPLCKQGLSPVAQRRLARRPRRTGPWTAVTPLVAANRARPTCCPALLHTSSKVSFGLCCPSALSAPHWWAGC